MVNTMTIVNLLFIITILVLYIQKFPLIVQNYTYFSLSPKHPLSLTLKPFIIFSALIGKLGKDFVILRFEKLANINK